MAAQTTAMVPGSLGAMAKGQSLNLAEAFLSVDAVILVDMSGSMAAMDAPGGISRYDAAERQLVDLQAQMPGKIAVVAFSSSVVFCPNGIPVRLGAGTDMAAALRFARPADGLARIILISDGWPDSEAETLKVARTFSHKVDTIFIGPEAGWDAAGRDFLRRLAQATGGQSLQGAAPGLFLAETKQLLLAAG